MWTSLNAAVTAAVDAWLWAFRSFSPFVQLCALALPVTIMALLAYRFASNQAAIRAVKNRLQAHLLELRLFQDDFGVTLQAQAQILKHSLVYAAHALVPMAVVIVPIALILVQVEARYAWRPIAPGESTIVEATLRSTSAVSAAPVSLVMPQGLVDETPPLRIDAQKRILWRVRAPEPGKYTVGIRAADGESHKQVVVGAKGRLSPTVYPANDFRTLGYPLEPALRADSDVTSITVGYARSRGEFAGLSSASWILFALTLVYGYALRGLFRVTF
jgi:hypothetical protein